MTSVTAFAGPSLTKTDMSRFRDFRFRPPIKQGDLIRFMNHPPDVCIIIDGYFGSEMSVLHKEILDLISRGTCVVGAASMGALRAAELRRYGMIGVGEVFRQYSLGALERDDAVAVKFGPPELGYPALSIPHVDIIATADALTQRGQITALEAGDLIRASEQLFYADRTFETIAQKWIVKSEDRAEVVESLTRNHVQRKRLDALTALRKIVRCIAGNTLPARYAICPPKTPAYRAAIRRVQASDGQHSPGLG